LGKKKKSQMRSRKKGRFFRLRIIRKNRKYKYIVLAGKSQGFRAGIAENSPITCDYAPGKAGRRRLSDLYATRREDFSEGKLNSSAYVFTNVLQNKTGQMRYINSVAF